MESSMEPNSRIRDVRKSLNMTQTEFGKKLGMKWFKIKDLELGRLTVTEDVAKKINGEFHINYRWILYGEKPKEIYRSGLNIESEQSFDINEQKLSAALEMSSDAKHAKDSRRISGKKSNLEFPIKVYVRFHDASVRIAAIKRAEGKCEICDKPAPFRRALDGSPFLEIHHLKPLSLGGDDTLENIIVACPNCHRKLHYG